MSEAHIKHFISDLSYLFSLPFTKITKSICCNNNKKQTTFFQHASSAVQLHAKHETNQMKVIIQMQTALETERANGRMLQSVLETERANVCRLQSIIIEDCVLIDEFQIKIEQDEKLITDLQTKANEKHTNICTICCENEITTCCYPCGHTYCYGCIAYSANCHICRCEINDTNRIYI